MSPQKVLRIVFPAHVDALGRFHETSVVQAMVDNGQWLAATVPATDGPCDENDFDPEHALFEDEVWPALYNRAEGFRQLGLPSDGFAP